MVKKIALFAVVATLAAAASAAPKKAAPAATLTSGEYTAHVGMLACSECGKNVEKVLNATKGIENAKVDSDKSTVTFKVKQGAHVKVAELQKKLKASADDMGMGADYRLSKIASLTKAAS